MNRIIFKTRLDRISDFERHKNHFLAIWNYFSTRLRLLTRMRKSINT